MRFKIAIAMILFLPWVIAFAYGSAFVDVVKAKLANGKKGN